MELPKKTVYGQNIPKKKFYENLDVTTQMKRSFVDEIKGVTWRNKIAADTVNLPKGQEVTEIEVLEVALRGRTVSEGILKLMDRTIPYHILYLMEHGGRYQAWISHKEEAQSGTAAFKVGGYYHTDWMTLEELPLVIEGLDLDAVYENFVRQVAGERLQSGAVPGESLEESVARDERRKKLARQISQLEAKVRKEKQFNKKVELNGRLKQLRKELEEV